MVTVTKTNFIEQKDDFLQHLAKATFVALDLEMTGIRLPTHLQQQQPPSKEDTPEVRYLQLKAVPERYSIVQVGLVLFRREGTQSVHNDAQNGNSNDANLQTSETMPKFTVRKYCFYLFPPAPCKVGDAGRWYESRDLTWNPASIHFLNQHQTLDWKEWTTNGIPFLPTDRATFLWNSFEEKYRFPTTDRHQHKRSKVEPTRQEDIDYIAKAMAMLREWMTLPSGEDKTNSFLLPPGNSYRRRCLYGAVEEEFPSLLLERDADHSQQIRAWRLTPNEKQARQEQKRQQEYQSLCLDQVGFSLIFHALTAACQGRFVAPTETQSCPPLPLVVHNGLMDLLFLLTHCKHPELPDTYLEAKRLIHATFPTVYDTKVLATECFCARVAGGKTGLEELYQKLPNAVSFAVSDESGIEKGEEKKAHEASQDAFMTGAIFLHLSNCIVSSPLFASLASTANNAAVDPLYFLEDKTTNDATVLFGKNKIYLMQTMYTIDLEQFSERDPLSGGRMPSAIYRVEGIDTSVSTHEIIKALAVSPLSLNKGDDKHREMEVAPEPKGAQEEEEEPLKPGVDYEIVWINSRTFLVATQCPPNEVPLLTSLPPFHRDRVKSETKLLMRGRRVWEALQRRFPSLPIVTWEEHLEGAKDTVPPSFLVPTWLTQLAGSFWRASDGGASRKRGRHN